MKIVEWFLSKDIDTVVNSLQDFPVHPKINDVVEYSRKNNIGIQVRTKDDLMVLGLSPSLVRPAWLAESMFNFSFAGCRIIATVYSEEHQSKFRAWGFKEKGRTFTYTG
jgi:hypothetical protein